MISREEITTELADRGLEITEGSASPEEMALLCERASKIGALSIGEVGFNAGFSAAAFLSVSSEVQVVSFDIGHHNCTQAAKELIDRAFPGRHELVIGDSRQTIPKYKPATLFDMVFIDGGHSYDEARADILNLRRLSNPGGLVVMDDVIPWKRWGIKPTIAWKEMCIRGVVALDQLYKDGKPVKRIFPPGRKLWALGRYL